jgi:hypothetical protein
MVFIKIFDLTVTFVYIYVYVDGDVVVGYNANEVDDSEHLRDSPVACPAAKVPIDMEGCEDNCNGIL